MAKFKISLNMEFCRLADKSFAGGVKIASELGYRWVEPIAHSSAERGKVTGTPVGCACGEGVVDWERVAQIMKPVNREIFLSVECGKIDEAARSLAFLKKALKKYLA